MASEGLNMSDNNTKSYHWDSGKGSRPRSYSVSQDEFCKNWDAIFGKKESPASEVVAADVSSETQDAVEG